MEVRGSNRAANGLNDTHTGTENIRIRINVIVTVGMFLTSMASRDDCSRFRGPSGQGIAESAVPVEWNSSEHVAWSFDLPGAGSSSPIVVGGRIFVTCYSGETGADSKRHLICVDAESGEELWQRSIDGPQSEDEYWGYLTEHGFASGTPVSDGKNVYAFSGRPASSPTQ